MHLGNGCWQSRPLVYIAAIVELSQQSSLGMERYAETSWSDKTESRQHTVQTHVKISTHWLLTFRTKCQIVNRGSHIQNRCYMERRGKDESSLQEPVTFPHCVFDTLGFMENLFVWGIKLTCIDSMEAYNACQKQTPQWHDNRWGPNILFEMSSSFTGATGKN